MVRMQRAVQLTVQLVVQRIVQRIAQRIAKRMNVVEVMVHRVRVQVVQLVSVLVEQRELTVRARQVAQVGRRTGEQVTVGVRQRVQQVRLYLTGVRRRARTSTGQRSRRCA